MKITKKVKYDYKLTEETLEKDIDQFIASAKNRDFAIDRQYGGEGLKIIKQYFKILNQKLNNQEFEECKICYEKLILFCIDASGANECDNLFDYEDLLAKIAKEFDDHIRGYFMCMVKTCSMDELAERISRYAQNLDIYGFDSDKEVLLTKLSKVQLAELEEKMLSKAAGMAKGDKDKQDIIYFLMGMASASKDKDKYLILCERFKGILNDEEFEYLKNEY